MKFMISDVLGTYSQGRYEPVHAVRNVSVV